MKLTHKTLLTVLALAAGANVFAQINRNQVPGPTDYDAFSRFIADRNIFDPARQPHYRSGTRPRPRPPHSTSAPFLSLVGIMSYTKGDFAFFNGSDPDLKQVLTVSGKVGGYTITGMTEQSVTLQSEDKKQTFSLKIGDTLRQENGRWRLPNADDAPVETTPADATQTTEDNSNAPATATPDSAGEPNDILKRLMQQREKDNQ
jgi:hypothetical protein